jgi:hypothetical protein
MVLVAGCGRQYAETTPNDEAMKRLIWENEHPRDKNNVIVKRTPEQAAREFFLPTYYFDPKKKHEPYKKNEKEEGKDDTADNDRKPHKKGAKVNEKDQEYGRPPDYFAGMDRIVTLKTWNGEDPPIDNPVFQLLDTALNYNQDNQPDKTKESSDSKEPSNNGSVSAKEQNEKPSSGWPDFATHNNPLYTNNEILGRNTWMLWCGGNEGFWDWLSSDSVGFIDLLKLIDSRNRAQRFEKGGLINEPGMMQSGKPDEFGLWLDVPTEYEARAWRTRYLKRTFDSIQTGTHKSQRGLKTNRAISYSEEAHPSARRSLQNGPKNDKIEDGGEMKGGYKDNESQYAYSPAYAYDYHPKYPPPAIYGVSSGVIGLRLFPNPNFDAEAQKRWNAQRYYSDPDYWNDPKLVRPYRVGVACAYCHASFHPLNPPRDVSNPSWENISGNVGAQYLRIRVAFANLLAPENFVYHILDSQPPGTIDTSLIASDNINNPNTMNAVFNLPQRVLLSLRNPHERIAASSASQPSVWDYDRNDEDRDDKVTPFFAKLLEEEGLLDEGQNANSHPQRRVPRILLDGADSIGAWGALARVYLNIGTYWEQWQRLHRTVVGFDPQKPFSIVDCERHSVYWHATQQRVAALRDYFLKVTPPMPMLATEGGGKRLEPIDEMQLSSRAKMERKDFSKLLAQEKARRVDLNKLQRGRQVFARNCIVCHSSIQPEHGPLALYPMRRTNEQGNMQKQNKAVAPKEQATQGNEKNETKNAAEELRDRYENKYRTLMDRRKEYRENDVRTREFWEHDPALWLGDAQYIKWAEEVVEIPEFWKRNYLSTDYRIPITLVKTNAGRAMATNALDGNMWDDFASESYQLMPSVGAIEYFDLYRGPRGEMHIFTPRHKVRNDVRHGTKLPDAGGGPGFYRVPTLVSIWATAPFLHNNSLGLFNNDPSVNGRLDAFDDSIRKLLWPQRRLESSSYNDATPERLQRDRGLIWRTPIETRLIVSGRRVPTLLGPEVSAVMKISERYPWLREVRPLWLPSGILLFGSYLLLLFDSNRWRRIVGALLVLSSLIVFALHWLYGQADWLAWIYPLSLYGTLLLVLGFVLLAIGFPKRLRHLAYFALLVAAVGLVLYLLKDQWRALEKLDQIPIGQLSILLALAAVVLLLINAAKYWRNWIALILVISAAAVLVFLLYNANVSGLKASEYLGPLWTYLLLAIAASLVLLTPNYKELARYAGYASLVLSLALGALIYFFAGRLGDIQVGPIPRGTPVNLIANVNPDADPHELKKAIKVTLSTLGEIESKHLQQEQADRLLTERVAPALMHVSKCPDFVMDHGHYYEWFDSMTDEDKAALIELLKTF